MMTALNERQKEINKTNEEIKLKNNNELNKDEYNEDVENKKIKKQRL